MGREAGIEFVHGEDRLCNGQAEQDTLGGLKGGLSKDVNRIRQHDGLKGLVGKRSKGDLAGQGISMESPAGSDGQPDTPNSFGSSDSPNSLDQANGTDQGTEVAAELDDISNSYDYLFKVVLDGNEESEHVVGMVYKNSLKELKRQACAVFNLPVDEYLMVDYLGKRLGQTIDENLLWKALPDCQFHLESDHCILLQQRTAVDEISADDEEDGAEAATSPVLFEAAPPSPPQHGIVVLHSSSTPRVVVRLGGPTPFNNRDNSPFAGGVRHGGTGAGRGFKSGGSGAFWDDTINEAPSREPGLAGLSNLGNTCFMNSSLQCLAHTVPLMQSFLSGQYMADLNRTNPLGMKGELAEAFGQLMHLLWQGGVGYVTPRKFKERIGRFAPQFSGYQQHDSQEFLAFLLDGLHEDLNRIKQKPYIVEHDTTGKPDSELAALAWASYRARNDSTIVDHCQGMYKSRLDCPKCGHVSVKFDPMMYLSLPLPESRMRHVSVVLVYLDGSHAPLKYVVEVPNSGTLRDVQVALWVLASPAELPTSEGDSPTQGGEAAVPGQGAGLDALHPAPVLDDKGAVLDAGGRVLYVKVVKGWSDWSGDNVEVLGPKTRVAEVCGSGRNSHDTLVMYVQPLLCEIITAPPVAETFTPTTTDTHTTLAAGPAVLHAAFIQAAAQAAMHKCMPQWTVHATTSQDGAAAPGMVADSSSWGSAGSTGSGTSPIPPRGDLLTAADGHLAPLLQPLELETLQVLRTESPLAPKPQEVPQVDSSHVLLPVAPKPIHVVFHHRKPRLHGVSTAIGLPLVCLLPSNLLPDSTQHPDLQHLPPKKQYSSNREFEVVGGLRRALGALVSRALRTFRTPAGAAQELLEAQEEQGLTQEGLAALDTIILDDSLLTHQAAGQPELHELKEDFEPEAMHLDVPLVQGVAAQGLGEEEVGGEEEDGLPSPTGPTAEPFNMWSTQEQDHARVPGVTGPGYRLLLASENGSTDWSFHSDPLQQAAQDSVWHLSLEWVSGADGRWELGAMEEGVPQHASAVAHALRQKGPKQPCSLTQCVDAFLQPEQLSEDDSWYCPQCKDHVQADKKLDLWLLPEVLVVHLKRFSYTSYSRDKLDTHVEFGPLLDLSSYVQHTNTHGASVPVGQAPSGEHAAGCSHATPELPLTDGPPCPEGLQSGPVTCDIAAEQAGVNESCALPLHTDDHAGTSTVPCGFQAGLVEAPCQQTALGGSVEAPQQHKRRPMAVDFDLSPIITDLLPTNQLPTQGSADNLAGGLSASMGGLDQLEAVAEAMAATDRASSQTGTHQSAPSTDRASSQAGTQQAPVNQVHLQQEQEQLPHPALYELYAVVNHFGSLGGGHYTAHAKKPCSDKWMTFDDSSVHPVEADEVCSPAAYVLFYRQRLAAMKDTPELVQDLIEQRAAAASALATGQDLQAGEGGADDTIHAGDSMSDQRFSPAIASPTLYEQKAPRWRAGSHSPTRASSLSPTRASSLEETPATEFTVEGAAERGSQRPLFQGFSAPGQADFAAPVQYEAVQDAEQPAGTSDWHSSWQQGGDNRNSGHPTAGPWASSLEPGKVAQLNAHPVAGSSDSQLALLMTAAQRLEKEQGHTPGDEEWEDYPQQEDDEEGNNNMGVLGVGSAYGRSSGHDFSYGAQGYSFGHEGGDEEGVDLDAYHIAPVMSSQQGRGVVSCGQVVGLSSAVLARSMDMQRRQSSSVDGDEDSSMGATRASASEPRSQADPQDLDAAMEEGGWANEPMALDDDLIPHS